MEANTHHPVDDQYLSFLVTTTHNKTTRPHCAALPPLHLLSCFNFLSAEWTGLGYHDYLHGWEDGLVREVLKDPSSIPRTHRKSQVCWLKFVIPEIRRWRWVNAWLTDQMLSRIHGPQVSWSKPSCFQNQGGELLKKGIWGWLLASPVPPLCLPCASAVPLSPSPPISFVVSICFFSQFTHFGSYTSRSNILTSRKQKLSLFGVSCTFIGNFEKYRSSVCFSLNMSFHLPVTLLSKKNPLYFNKKVLWINQS